MGECAGQIVTHWFCTPLLPFLLWAGRKRTAQRLQTQWWKLLDCWWDLIFGELQKHFTTKSAVRPVHVLCSLVYWFSFIGWPECGTIKARNVRYSRTERMTVLTCITTLLVHKVLSPNGSILWSKYLQKLFHFRTLYTTKISNQDDLNSH